jgi:hypothetical protein
MYRIRVGDYRIVYEILWAERRIIIHHIAPREKAYGRKSRPCGEACSNIYKPLSNHNA